jgi:hypothetical protein
MLQSLLYVSRRTQNASTTVHDVDDIVAGSRIRNVALDLTGALVATPTHFAQVLEGSPAAIEEIMASITRDRRHYDIVIAPIEQPMRREFERWALAYHGDSTYVAQMLTAAIEAADFDLANQSRKVRSLMAMLA